MGAPPGLPTSPGSEYPVERTYYRARNALILGLVGIFPLSVVTGIPAIVVGVHALRAIKASDGDLHGRLSAWIGIVLGCLSCALLAGLFYRART